MPLMHAHPKQTHPNQKKRIVLFGSQGSPNLFSDSAVAAVRDIASSSPAAAIFVSRCHAAFLEEYLSITAREQQLIGVDLDTLHDHSAFLAPGKHHRCNGLIQSTTICLYQILLYIADAEQQAKEVGDLTEHVREATGLCSGLIPAAVIASASTLVDLLNYGVEAFRVAFWVGYRVVLEGQRHVSDLDNQDSWSLAVLGLNLSQVEERLKEFCLQIQLQSLKISAIMSPKAISISGVPSEVSLFRKHLGSDIATMSLHVNAWYHGGEQLKHALDQVVEDIARRQIYFPDAVDLKIPLRSTLDGTIVDPQSLTTESLVQWVIKQILVCPIDWTMVCCGIAASLEGPLKLDPRTEVDVLSFGPSSESLFAELKGCSYSSILNLVDMSPFKSSRSDTWSTNPSDIAIVGMGVNFPKGKDVDELWSTISEGLTAVSGIPQSRFDISHYRSPEINGKPRTMPTAHGAFLDDIWGFDNSFFNISPREAKSMDPQQRILLSTSQKALEDAGFVGDATPSFQRSSMGCYIGLATGDYTDNLRDDIDVYYSPGTLRAFHSGRISYVHKLSGPSIVTDTACSSSAVALYQACRSLQNGDCTAAIAGGVNVICSPDMYLGLSQGHFLNDNGGCKPFDAAADGYCRAEGCGIFVLKRLSDAISENDRIHGVIKGIEVNQSGNSVSITQPHSETQANLFRRVLKKANVDAASVSLVEAHGTGTQVGDQGEVASIQNVFGSSHSKSNPLVVSSVKGNIGHAEAASGAAGLVKLLIMLQKKQIAPQAGFATLNPCLVGIDDAGIRIPRDSQSWEHSVSRPRRALLNNFGAAGSNVALLLQEARQPTGHMEEDSRRSAFTFNISTKSKHALETSLKQHQDLLSTTKGPLSLKDICYTASARRQVYNHRLSVICSSLPDLKAKLEKVDVSSIKPAKVAKSRIFVFSGQGAIHHGMGSELMKTAPFFRRIILECDNIVQKLGLPSMLDYYERPESSSSLDNEDSVAVSQCACVSLEYALAKLLISWNLKPDYVVGHSLGEYAALAIAGALTLEDTLYVVARRAELMTAKCPPKYSGMVACSTSSSTAEKVLIEHNELSRLSVACRNSVTDCVVAGPVDCLADFAATCRDLGIKTKRLSVPYGFHSPAMDPILEPLADIGRSVSWSPPAIPVASNVYGRFFGPQDMQSNYFALHARRPVLFDQIIKDFGDQQIFENAICIEIGPHPITLPMIKKCLSEGVCHFVSTLNRDREAWTTLSAALSQVSLIADELDWRETFSGSGAKMVDLPGHPLHPISYGVPYQEPHGQRTITQAPNIESYTETRLRLLPRLLTSKSSENNLILETSTQILGSLIAGHNVGGTCICPASLFHELVLEAAQIALTPSDSKILKVSDMTFPKPLIYEPAESPKTIHVSVCKLNAVSTSTDTAEIEVSVKAVGKGIEETTCCSAVVSVRVADNLEHRFLKYAALVKRQSRHLLRSDNLHNTFRTKLLYETIFTRVVAYGPEYQTLKSLSVSDTDLEGIGSFQLPPNSKTDGYIAPPVFTDTLLHAAGFVANLFVPSEEVCICGHVDSVEVLYDRIDYNDNFTIYCSLVDIIKGTILADAFAVNTAGRAVAVVRGMVFKRLRLSVFQKLLNHKRPSLGEEASTSQPSIQAIQSPAAPTLHTSGSNTPSTLGASHAELKKTFMRIVGEVYGAPDGGLDSSQSLADLGIDSMMQIEMSTKLSQAFPNSSIDYDSLFECETLQELEDRLVSMEDQTRKTPAKTSRKTSFDSKSTNSPASSSTSLDSEPEGLEGISSRPQTSAKPKYLQIVPGTRTALCLFHDGSGQSSMYRQIQSADQSILAFSDPDFMSASLQTSSVEQMASRYISSLSPSETPSLILGGWSFGGVVAYEAARQLFTSGIQIRGLLLIDSPLPHNHVPLPEEVIAHVTTTSSSFSATAKTNAPHSNLLREFKHCAHLLSKYNPPPLTHAQRSSTNTVMLRSKDTMNTTKLCGVKYGWLERQDVRDAAVDGWRGLVGEDMEVLELEGNHFEVFGKGRIEGASAVVRRACEMIDCVARV